MWEGIIPHVRMVSLKHHSLIMSANQHNHRHCKADIQFLWEWCYQRALVLLLCDKIHTVCHFTEMIFSQLKEIKKSKNIKLYIAYSEPDINVETNPQRIKWRIVWFCWAKGIEYRVGGDHTSCKSVKGGYGWPCLSGKRLDLMARYLTTLCIREVERHCFDPRLIMMDLLSIWGGLLCFSFILWWCVVTLSAVNDCLLSDSDIIFHGTFVKKRWYSTVESIE